MADKKQYEKTPFRKYYEEFCEVFGHPLWMLPMMCIVFFVGIETLHTSYNNIDMGDALGYCGQKEFVKELKRFYDNNAY